MILDWVPALPCPMPTAWPASTARRSMSTRSAPWLAPDWNPASMTPVAIPCQFLASAPILARQVPYRLACGWMRVASMLYLDIRNAGEWVPNVDGGNHNYEAISLLEVDQRGRCTASSHAMTIAEESTRLWGLPSPPSSVAWGLASVEYGLDARHPQLYAKSRFTVATPQRHDFSMVYHYDENFILSLSHDEVVHGKHSLLYTKMPGTSGSRPPTCTPTWASCMPTPARSSTHGHRDRPEQRGGIMMPSCPGTCCSTPARRPAAADPGSSTTSIVMNLPCIRRMANRPVSAGWITGTRDQQHLCLAAGRQAGAHPLVANLPPRCRIGLPISGAGLPVAIGWYSHRQRALLGQQL